MDVYGKSTAGKGNSQCKPGGKSMSGESEGPQGSVEGGKQGGRHLGDEGRGDRSVGTCKPLIIWTLVFTLNEMKLQEGCKHGRDV